MNRELPYSFCIQTDTGVTLYSRTEGMPSVNSQAFGLMQVFCQSSEENNGFPQMITTKSGLIAFTSLNFSNENQLFLFLALQKLATTSETAIQWSQKMLYHLRNLIILHTGIKDFEDDLGKNYYDRLKRQLKILDSKLAVLFSPNTLALQ